MMAKTVVEKAKKVVKKATAKKYKLRAVRDGSHGIDGGIYTYKAGDTLTLSKKSHYDAMKHLSAFQEEE